MVRRKASTPPPDDMGQNPPAGEVVKRKRGRKPGSPSSAITAMVRAKAVRTGKLPHEILLDIARGEPIDHHVWDHEKKAYVKRSIYPPWEDRVDAAKAAAPFYAPRLAASVVKTPGSQDPSGMSDKQLNDELRNLLLEFGITNIDLVDEDTLDGANLVRDADE